MSFGERFTPAARPPSAPSAEWSCPVRSVLLQPIFFAPIHNPAEAFDHREVAEAGDVRKLMANRPDGRAIVNSM